MSRIHSAVCCFILLVFLAPFGLSFAPPSLPSKQHFVSEQLSTSTASWTLFALSNAYLENDLVSVKVPARLLASNDVEEKKEKASTTTRFCVVRPDATVAPLCRHEDDVDTDLFVDPRPMGDVFWKEVTDEDIAQQYGEGWYGQRPVPSLGGGPGYGAEADEIWSIDESLLEQLEEDSVQLPILDVGIAHGEKARGGAY